MENNNQWYSLLAKIEDCVQDAKYINETGKSIPMIEIDLAMEKLNIIYNTLFELKITTFANEETGFLSKSTSVISEAINKTGLNNNEKFQAIFSPIGNSNETFSMKPAEKETTTVQENSSEVNNIPIPEPEEKKLDSDAAITDKQPENISAKPMEPSASIYDITSIFMRKDVSALKQMKPVTDLVHAISINDKIMFIRELFGNNVDEYNAMVHQLNNCSTFDEACTIIEKKFGNNFESDTMQSLLELMYRRFLK